MTTRPIRLAGSTVETLVGLTPDEVRAFTDIQVSTYTDLMLLDADDFVAILGQDDATFIKRKRLAAVVKYLRRGKLIDANTLMTDIILGSYGPEPTAGRAGVIQTPQVSTSAPIKLSPSDVPSFSGEIEEQDTYKTKIEAIVGQTTFKHLLARAPATPTETERDEELFNVFKNSFLGGTAYHLIGSALKDAQGNALPPSGHRLWQNFLGWCNSGGRKDALISKLKSDLKALVLDGDHVDGFDYVNQWITKHNELSDLGATVPGNTMISDFVEQIHDDDFKVTKELLESTMLKVNRGAVPLNVQEFYDSVSSRQRTLSKLADEDMNKKSRRANFQRNGGNKRGYSSDSSTGSRSSHQSNRSNGIQSINLNLPSAIFNELSDPMKKAVVKWRNDIKNGRKVDEDAIKNMLNHKPGKTDKASKKSRKTKKSKKKVRATKLIRRAGAQPSKITSEEVRLLMMSDDSASTSEDELSAPVQEDLKKVAVHKILRKLNPAKYNKSDFKHMTILDTGTEWTVVGGAGWLVTQVVKRTLNMSAVDKTMGDVRMTLCDAVTAVPDESGNTQLIGVKRCGYSATLNDEEAVLNTNLMREAGMKVNCCAKRHGGQQQMQLSSGKPFVPLEYNATAYKLYAQCRAPTQDEMRTIQINWIDCHVEDLLIDDGKKPIRRDKSHISQSIQLMNPSASNPSHDDSENTATMDTVEKDPKHNAKEPTTSDVPKDTETVAQSDVMVPAVAGLEKKTSNINWRMTLGYCTPEVVSKTLKHTTQYFATPVESETRAYPRQHRQKRLLPLHVRRIPDRTCGDTFFSSIRSIRGYTCVQLFAALFADFLWVKCLRRESQVPGSYQDFIKEVGAPNELLTDNSKVQSGEKFAKINRDHLIKHNFSTPHNQNQNQAERKIQDVKHRSVLVLFVSKAPLLFWCYAVQFICDCLNHTSKGKLGDKTPVEVLQSNTPDISVFRFEFWQPIEYLDPNVKYPDCKWKPGRFLGIARGHGDPFTYKIWTEPEIGGWKKGTELVRNVVRPREEDNKTTVIGASTVKELEDFLLLPSRERHLLDNLRAMQKKRERNPSRLPLNLKEPKKKKKKRGRSNSGGRGSVAKATNPSAGSPVLKRVQFADELETETVYAVQATQPLDDSQLVSEEVSTLESDRIIDAVVMEDPSTPLDDTLPDVSNELDPAISSEERHSIIAINGHRFKLGKLQMRLIMDSEETQWVDFRDVKEDHPRRCAIYIVDHYKPRSGREGRDRVLSWAKKTLRDCERAVRRMVRLYDFVLDDDDNVRRVRRAVRAKKKQMKASPKKLKYGVQVPRNVNEAYQLDERSGTTFWEDAISKEMAALYELDCFEYREKGYRPEQDTGYQWTRVHMIFDVKTDLRRKARLVAGGHLLEVFDTEVYSSTVKGISVKLLHVIAHQNKLRALCGDVGNAFVTADTREKVYFIAGREFGERQGMTVIIRKALYGLASSAACFHAHFGDTLRSFGFVPTRFDNDVWIRLSKDKTTYEYICSHVDDFCIFSRDPESIMQQIKSVFTIKGEGPPDYYLGNDFKKDRKGRWCIGCKTYIKEGIKRIESMFGTLDKHDIPMVRGDHPELDDTEQLNDEEHTEYQMLIGNLNWIVTIGRIDIAFAVSSLSRFVACPRKGHKDRALYLFGYLKKFPNRRIRIDSRDPIIVANGAEGNMEIDLQEKFSEQYPDAKEYLDDKLPKPLFDELAITAYVDSDHAHDKVSRRSMTGLIIFVGRTPVFALARRQGAIETSTYSAEFMAMKTAVEEVMSVRYMLRCLGLRVDRPTPILGDNRSVILNATIPSSLLKKKHVAISYHMTRESAAAGICRPLKTKGEWNFSDVCTKAQVRKTHADLVAGMMC